MDSINATGKLQIHFQAHGLESLSFHQEFHLCVYRIVQELLNNIVKHAMASKAFVLLTNKDGCLLLSIQDNGKGFDTKSKKTGIGLINMKTRAENFGGTFRLKSAPGGGCKVQVDFPLVMGTPPEA